MGRPAPRPKLTRLASKILNGKTSIFSALVAADFTRCIILNAASLVCACVGNLFLLLNFTRHVRYIVALPITIILFYLATGILIAITSSMNLHIPPGADGVYSQGFWHAVIAACLYMLCSMILMVNMCGYFLGHYPQHFTLTDEQRNLILQTMVFCVWLGGGAAMFSKTAHWSFVDSLYFCLVTILTIGFGDFYSPNDLSRALVFPYSVGGIIILGLIVTSIHKFAGELSKDNVIKKHAERQRQKTLTRIVSEPLKSDEANSTGNGNGSSLSLRKTQSDPLPETPHSPQPRNPVSRIRHNHKGAIGRTISAIAQPVKAIAIPFRKKQKLLWMKEEKDRFDAMRAIQRSASKFRKWYALTLSVTAFGLLWCVGAVVFWQVEQATQQLSYFQALYFCWVSLITVGYGDLSPKSNAGKPFFIIWALTAVPTMTILVSDMGDTVIAAFKRGTFRLADWTILPKAGIYRAFIKSNPLVSNWTRHRLEKKLLQREREADPPLPSLDPSLTLEALAEMEDPSDAELTRRLANAIRKTADDLKTSPPRRYGYEEWVEFTRLIRFTSCGSAEQVQQDEEDEGAVEWDWIGDDSPMISDLTEAEWILDRLCESLLRLLKQGNMVSLTGANEEAASIPSRTVCSTLRKDLETPSSLKKGPVDEILPT